MSLNHHTLYQAPCVLASEIRRSRQIKPIASRKYNYALENTVENMMLVLSARQRQRYGKA